ncbi:hypothetical protein HGB48_15840 [Actinomadura latina]|uniref:Uncharacterized protein n=1 Tax=Actinomadura latina TaxID=163603 RepID=A0A846Z4P4_9ACTN|nr:hypothetical protein [Actinomadura latina]NKZ05206.1 hypothetical protein [Actinomadura latina]
MRQIVIVAAAALIAAVVAVAGAVAFIKLNPGESHDAGRAANHTSAPPAQSPAQKQAPREPRPTVTVTPPPRTVPPRPAPPPAYGDADANFLAMIAADGITAPDGWAIEAGNATCGEDYGTARGYLTDGGLYDYHVQTFLDDWTITHDGC